MLKDILVQNMAKMNQRIQDGYILYDEFMT